MIAHDRGEIVPRHVAIGVFVDNDVSGQGGKAR